MDTAGMIQDTQATPRTTPGLGLLFLSLASTTAFADFCFWRQNPRLSVGLFAIGFMGIILLNRPRMRWTSSAVALVALICGAAIGSAIDLCFSNVLVLVTLTLALAGESYYEPLQSGWNRWSEELWTMAKTPARWIWLMIEVAAQARQTGPTTSGFARRTARMAWITVPGLLATLFFGMILCNGNALFAKLASDWTIAINNWILSLDLNFWRLFFWSFVAWIALPILWPSPAPGFQRAWTKELPSLPEFTTHHTARLQSAVTLALLNALFCCVNTIDVAYLWARHALPPAVSYSAFVHQGVFSLITAVLFSALLLAGVFQQVRSVSGWLPLRLLGLVWIAQNLVLLAGVFLRVKLYVEAFDLTVTRVNLVFFLALVAIGFVLLAIHVWRGRTLGWLLNANMLATFFLLYAVQFLDTGGFVARYNVKLWLNSHETRALDLVYLNSLGPPAFEAIESVARSGMTKEAGEASGYIKTARERAQDQLDRTSFASWQFREMSSERRLLTRIEP